MDPMGYKYAPIHSSGYKKLTGDILDAEASLFFFETHHGSEIIELSRGP